MTETTTTNSPMVRVVIYTRAGGSFTRTISKRSLNQFLESVALGCGMILTFRNGTKEVFSVGSIEQVVVRDLATNNVSSDGDVVDIHVSHPDKEVIRYIHSL